MRVRMVRECRSPRVQHQARSDLRPEMLGVGRDGHQGLRRHVEQQLVDDGLVGISEDRRLAIQLSQNAINGKDDPNILAQLYTSMHSLEWKRYSGVTDDAFKCTDEKMAALGITHPKYEELTIVFLQEEKAAFLDLVARIEASKKAQVLVGEIVTFNALFDAIVRVKQEKKVINNAVALRLLAERAASALDAEKVVPEAPVAAPARKVA